MVQNKGARVIKLAGGDRRKAAAAKCPICGRPAVPDRAPFCSKRCADEDLSRWLTGVYRIPTNETPESEKEPQSPPGEDTR